MRRRFELDVKKKELHRNGKSTSIYHDSWNARLNNNCKGEFFSEFWWKKNRVQSDVDVKKGNISECLMVEFMVSSWHGRI
jgi:hypothetical protein